MTDDPGTTDRLTAIESLLMHLQHEFEQLSEAILEQRRELDSLRRDMACLSGQVASLELGPEQRDPKLEKPPHY